MSELLDKFRRDPIGLVSRGIRKTVLDPVRYRRGSGYDAEGYWRDRLRRHTATSLRGAGDEGLSEAQNEQMYVQARSDFAAMCERHGVTLAAARVLEIGLGNGFWTRALRDAGVRDFDGIDVTDALFERFRRDLPGYRFHQSDITSAAPPVASERDLVMFIDVIEHIVEEDAFRAAMRHAGACVAPGGMLAVSPIAEATGRKLFYTRFWSLADVEAALEGFELVAVEPFRYSELAWLRRLPEANASA